MLGGAVALGFIAADMEISPEKFQFFSWHKSIGVTIWILTLARLLWRFYSPPPSAVAMPMILHISANIAHWLLYIILIVLPILGWLSSSAWGVPVVWFGIIELPNLIEPSKELGETFSQLHQIIAIILLWLIGIHVGAAFFHHYIMRDRLISRMWKGWLPTFLVILLPTSFYIEISNTNDVYANTPHTWYVHNNHSYLRFHGSTSTFDIKGTFPQWDAIIIFDPAQPETASLEVVIDLNSIKTDSPVASESLPQQVWMHTAAFPKAYYKAYGFKKKDKEKHWLINGTLELKGIQFPVPIEAIIELDAIDQTAIVSAQASFNRLNFNVGEDTWSDTSIVKNEILIDIKIKATAK